MASEPPESDRDAVLAANQAFYDAFNRKDMDAMLRAWAANAPLSCIHPGWNVLEGRGPVLDSWRGIIANPDQARVVVGGATVTLLGDTAIVICRELVSASPLAATNVFLRENGEWRMVHHQSGPVAVL